MGLEVHTEDAEGRAAIRLVGELDLSTAPRVRRSLAEVEARPGLRELTLDYSGLDFVDSTGLQLLLDADVRAAQSGRRLVVVAGSGEARRLFELADVLANLTVADLR